MPCSISPRSDIEIEADLLWRHRVAPRRHNLPQCYLGPLYSPRQYDPMVCGQVFHHPDLRRQIRFQNHKTLYQIHRRFRSPRTTNDFSVPHDSRTRRSRSVDRYITVPWDLLLLLSMCRRCRHLRWWSSLPCHPESTVPPGSQSRWD